MGSVQIKRIYEAFDNKDGKRILVDRLWPRGLTKKSTQIDEWMKGVAPSTELRKWFHHEPDKWTEFVLRYTAELKENDTVPALLELIDTHPATTLLYAAHNEQYNHALVLQQFIIDLQN